MTKLPRITVITPSFNQGDYIEATIQSVLSQGYQDLEYIVMDGGSTDHTLDILRRYDGQLQWISEKDRGQSDALNKGFRRATGEIIAFLNSDDRYEPESLLTVGRIFAERPDVMWLTGRCRNIDHDDNEIRGLITSYKNFWLRLRSFKVLQVLNFISQPATFWRREVYESVGDLDEGLHYAMEYDYWMRIGQQYRLSTTNVYLASFRIHPTSKAGSSADGQFETELQIIARHTRSPWVLGLHRLHSTLIVNTYRWLLKREHARVEAPQKQLMKRSARLS